MTSCTILFSTTTNPLRHDTLWNKAYWIVTNFSVVQTSSLHSFPIHGQGQRRQNTQCHHRVIKIFSSLSTSRPLSPPRAPGLFHVCFVLSGKSAISQFFPSGLTVRGFLPSSIPTCPGRELTVDACHVWVKYSKCYYANRDHNLSFTVKYLLE